MRGSPSPVARSCSAPESRGFRSGLSTRTSLTLLSVVVPFARWLPSEAIVAGEIADEDVVAKLMRCCRRAIGARDRGSLRKIRG